MALMRTCKQCKGEFLLDYSHGRPREYCEGCVPQGFKLARQPQGQMKLRRLTPSLNDGRDLGA
jgi:hypothetical protein